MGWINGGLPPKAHTCRVPPIVRIGKFGPGVGSQWECDDCHQLWEVTRKADGKLGWRRSDGPPMDALPTRAEVVDRMMLALPVATTPDYPGDQQVRNAFMVALYALERLKLDGGKWLKN
ncbi:MAG TPA: hypothetical protein VGH72_33715 [Pseudonocardia sp.]|jgi:hypothetical protein